MSTETSTKIAPPYSFRCVPGYRSGSKNVSSLTLVPTEQPYARGASAGIVEARPDIDELLRPPPGWHCKVFEAEIELTCDPSDRELLEHLCDLLSQRDWQSLIPSSWPLYDFEDQRSVLVEMLEMTPEEATSQGRLYANRLARLMTEYRADNGVDLLKSAPGAIERFT